jgi:hypothetical protein
VVITPNEFFVHSIEDLIDFAIIEIQEPLDLILETPVGHISKPNDLSEDENPNSNSEDMEENNGNEEEREVPL